MSEKRNVIYFAYNKTIIDYTITETEKYLNSEFNVIVLHISGLTKDRADCKQKDNYSFETIDISNYNSIQILRLLRKLHPCVLIFVTYQAYYDFLLFKIAQILSIRTIFHDHGVVYGNTSIHATVLNWPTIIRLITFFKNLVILILFRLRFDIIRDVYLFIKRKYIFYLYDSYLIYSLNNLKHYSKILPINPNLVIISGFPLFSDNNEKLLLTKMVKENKFIYIQQYFRKYHAATATYEEEINLILQLHKILLKNGYVLEVRLHPIENISDYEILIKYGISVVNNIKLVKHCSTAKALIGHYSTALIAAIPFNIPLFIIEFPKTKPEHMIYYNIYLGFGKYLKSIDEFDSVLQNTKEVFNCKYTIKEANEFIGENNTYEKNANDLIQMINSFSD